MRLLRLTWERKSNNYLRGHVLGDPEAIRDLYWQLTHNYVPQDGTEIGNITIYDMNGDKVDIKEFMFNPHSQIYPPTRLEDWDE